METSKPQAKLQTETQTDTQIKPAGLSPLVFDGRYDSDWWTADRGCPPMRVLAGAWILDGIIAIGIGAVIGFILFAALLWLGIAAGLILSHESRYTGSIFAILFLSVVAGLLAGLPFLKAVIRVTRLRLLLRQYTEEEFEQAYAEHERRSFR